MHAPTMRTIDLAGDDGLRATTTSFVEAPPDWLVATTGMGMRAWLAAADGWGLRAALLESFSRSTTIIARGAKASSAVRQTGLDVAWRAPSESMADVIEHLLAVNRDPEATKRPADGTVALQLFDPDGHPSTAELGALSGRLVELPVYRWLLPEDTSAAERLVTAALAGEVAAITFTSQPAVWFLFDIAEGLGRRQELIDACNRGDVVPVCIGPVCAEAAVDVGLTTMIWPEPFRLPPMVRLVADRLGVEPPADGASELADPLP
jgi:uroporphyrinogen-III synthase